MGKALKIERCIDTGIKKGETVKLTDGTGLSLVDGGTDYYIVHHYLKITGSVCILSDIEAIVLETNLQDYVCESEALNICYLQDIVIQVGLAKFRTCSQFVRRVKPKPFVTIEGVDYSENTLRSLIKKAID